MSMALMRVRDRRCGDGHEWTAAVHFSLAPGSRDGETVEYCPRCGMPAQHSGSPRCVVVEN